jgi:hypothetical protein
LRIAQPFKAGLRSSRDQVPKRGLKSCIANAKTPDSILDALRVAPLLLQACCATFELGIRAPPGWKLKQLATLSGARRRLYRAPFVRIEVMKAERAMDADGLP